MKSVLKQSCMTAAGVALLAFGALATAQAAEQLTVVSWGGAYTTSQVKAYHEPYSAETGVKILSENYNGESGRAHV